MDEQPETKTKTQDDAGDSSRRHPWHPSRRYH